MMITILNMYVDRPLKPVYLSRTQPSLASILSWTLTVFLGVGIPRTAVWSPYVLDGLLSLQSRNMSILRRWRTCEYPEVMSPVVITCGTGFIDLAGCSLLQDTGAFGYVPSLVDGDVKMVNESNLMINFELEPWEPGGPLGILLIRCLVHSNRAPLNALLTLNLHHYDSRTQEGPDHSYDPSTHSTTRLSRAARPVRV